MTRSILPILLVLSLTGNAWLAFRAARPAAQAIPAAAASRAAPAAAQRPVAPPAQPTAGVAALTEKFSRARTSAEFRTIAAELRALGLPETLIHSVVQSLVGQEIFRRQREIFDWSAVPYWKDPSPTAEQQRALRALNNERRALLADLGFPPNSAELATRQRQYGDLAETKISAIEKIQQDYAELRQEMYEQAQGNPAGSRDVAAQQRLLNEEMQRDIDALLSPQEKLDYELRRSNTASQLRSQLRNLEVNEQEYRELFAAQKAYEAAVTSTGAARPLDAQEAGLAAWEEQQAQVRRTLGDDRFRQFLLVNSMGGQNAAPFFAERPDISIDQIQSIALLNRSLPVEVQREVSAPGLTAEERRARSTALIDRYRSQLTQILGPQHAQDAISRGVVPMLRGNGVTMPAVRLPGGGG